MFGKSLQLSRGLYSKNLATFATTVAIFSGSLNQDYIAEKIIKGLRKSSHQSIQFIGIGGPSIRQNFSQLYACSSEFDNLPFEAHKYYIESVQEFPLTLYRIPTLYKIRKVLKKLDEKRIYSEFINRRVSAIINVGNFSFTRRINTNIRNTYQAASKIAPPSFLYDDIHFNRHVDHQRYLDYQFYTIPRIVDNWAKYQFPSMCVGYDGVYAAYKYLSNFRSDNSIDFNTQHFDQRITQLTRHARKDFRQKNKISQDNFVIVLSPGNQKNEIDFSFNNFSKGLTEFLKIPKISTITSKNFTVIITSPNSSRTEIAKYITTHANKLQSLVKTIVVEEKDKYAAFSAADFGVLHNGQITAQGAACQLPAIVIDSMSFGHAYLSYLFNIYQSPLNIATQNQGYPQFLSKSAANPHKISEMILQHFENPKLKFHYIKIYKNALQDIIKKSGSNPNLNVSVTGNQTSYDLVSSYINKYKKLDIAQQYSNKWGYRKTVIQP